MVPFLVTFFDYFVFSQTWAPEFCHIHNCKGKNDFVIHGLWPQYNNNSYPSFCLPCEEFQPSLLNKNLIQKYWSDTKLSNDIDWDFLKHEWEKHGCCSGMNFQEYFDKALSLRQQWDFKKVFESVEIIPNKTYSKDLLISVAKDFCGNKCTIVLHCIKNNLIELWITLDKELNVIKKTIDSTCPNEVYF